MQVWDTNEELDKWNAGEVSFKDDHIKNAFEMVKSVFDEGLFYPGEGALAVTQDQLYGAISSHKVGFIFEPTTSVKTTIDNSGLKDYKIRQWVKIQPIRYSADVTDTLSQPVPKMWKALWKQ